MKSKIGTHIDQWHFANQNPERLQSGSAVNTHGASAGENIVVGVQAVAEHDVS